jgi:alkylation response protein AidB-like acyl-CoA dehydrogenase
LVGEENAGMRCMFTMMNNARLAVGHEGLGLAERAYQAALAYARERTQGRAAGRAAPDHRLPRRAPDAAHHALADRRDAGALLRGRRRRRP